MNRYLFSKIEADALKKMVFIGGPRQVGKTTLALSLLSPKSKNNPAYFNWDIVTHKKKMKNLELPPKEKLIIFDEVHKYAKWRNLVKGFYDLYYPDRKLIVTGSARLDYYKKGGDSLVGRYFYYRLHPFSLSELAKNPSKADLEQLLKFGGFPEPFLTANSNEHQRWQKLRMERVLREDLRDLENVKEISLIELLVESLPARVGSPLSVKSLKEDLEVAHDTVERWLKILENLYVCFRISPFGSSKIRAVKKEQKLYFWDWSQVEDSGARFENLVASHLLKYCHYHEDVSGAKMELRFVRDTDKREIDFVVIKNKKPLFAVECKSGEKTTSPHHKYFRERTAIPKFYQVHLGTADFGDEDKTTRILPFTKFCQIENLV